MVLEARKQAAHIITFISVEHQMPELQGKKLVFSSYRWRKLSLKGRNWPQGQNWGLLWTVLPIPWSSGSWPSEPSCYSPMGWSPVFAISARAHHQFWVYFHRELKTKEDHPTSQKSTARCLNVSAHLHTPFASNKPLDTHSAHKAARNGAAKQQPILKSLFVFPRKNIFTRI